MLAQGYVAAQHSSVTAWRVSESEEDIEVSFYPLRVLPQSRREMHSEQGLLCKKSGLTPDNY